MYAKKAGHVFEWCEPMSSEHATLRVRNWCLYDLTMHMMGQEMFTTILWEVIPAWLCGVLKKSRHLARDITRGFLNGWKVLYKKS